MSNPGNLPWPGGYAYSNGQGQYPQQGRQSMVVIPTPSSADLQQYQQYQSVYESVQQQPQHKSAQTQHHVPTNYAYQQSNGYLPQHQHYQPSPQQAQTQHQVYYTPPQYPQVSQYGQVTAGYEQAHSTNSPSVAHPQLPSSQQQPHQQQQHISQHPLFSQPYVQSQQNPQSYSPQVSSIVHPALAQSQPQRESLGSSRDQPTPEQTVRQPAPQSHSKPSAESQRPQPPRQSTPVPKPHSRSPQQPRQRQSTTKPVPELQSPALKGGQNTSVSSKPTSNLSPKKENPSQVPVAPSGNATPKSLPSVAHPKLSAKPVTPAIDYQSLMLALADTYILAARDTSVSAARMGKEVDIQRYYQLMATALGCIESVIKHWKFSDPRFEARLRLRYATLLYEETENEQEAQAVLSKGITVCERSRLLDLKYSMLHLLARFQFRNSPRAALKTIDNLMSDLETYQHTAWIYAFRLLRLSLTLQLPQHSDTGAAIQHVRALTSLAESKRHIPVLILGYAMEALIHIRSGSTESADLAQRVLASARSHQLDSSLQKVPQLKAMTTFLDLACELIAYKPDHAAPKMKEMQQMTDGAAKDGQWRQDGIFHVPTEIEASETLDEDADGIMKRDENGMYALGFTWLTRSELYSLGYLMSGMSLLGGSSVDDKAEMFLTEGVKLTRENFAPDENARRSLSEVSAHLDQKSAFRHWIRLGLVFLYCNRSDFAAAENTLVAVQNDNIGEVSSAASQIVLYLDGVVKQGMGDDQAALAAFSAPELALPSRPSKQSGANLDLRILSSMSRVAILMQSPSTRSEASSLLEALRRHAELHSNASILSAANILSTTVDPSIAIVKMKSYLQIALKAAKEVGNSQLMAIIMNLMNVRFFTNIVGDQAEKSAKVGVSLSKKTGSPLWQAVANQSLGACMELHGRREEAEAALAAAAKMMELVPQGVKDQYAAE